MQRMVGKLGGLPVEHAVDHHTFPPVLLHLLDRGRRLPLSSRRSSSRFGRHGRRRSCGHVSAAIRAWPPQPEVNYEETLEEEVVRRA